MRPDSRRVLRTRRITKAKLCPAPTSERTATVQPPQNLDCGRLTDFGFSQASLEASSPLLGGTLGFAAPEQIAPAFGRISPQTDIYAIGGLIHWYLYGKPPMRATVLPKP
ncbi:hypothetical protein Mal15_67450 [Stieleria maiorica]|uniref:Protein kinase domain-containing protein n=1 Tax=Stieleria maiorica TaxID=2795974 RepID=A0A5B9MNT5_9BACT|nr:hypothetical protein Mal15_67450 [Stieleria maiorica]